MSVPAHGARLLGRLVDVAGWRGVLRVTAAAVVVGAAAAGVAGSGFFPKRPPPNKLFPEVAAAVAVGAGVAADVVASEGFGGSPNRPVAGAAAGVAVFVTEKTSQYMNA